MGIFEPKIWSKPWNELALCAGNEHVVQNEEFPKNIEVIIGKLDHCAYAGIYEREPVMYKMISINYKLLIIIDFMAGVLPQDIEYMCGFCVGWISTWNIFSRHLPYGTVISTRYKIIGNDVGWLSQIKLSQLG